MRRFLLSLVLLSVVNLPCHAQPGTPIATGQASFVLGDSALTYTRATGSLNESYGFITATVTFADPRQPNGDHLTVSVMAKKPGAVDLDQPMGNGIGYWRGGTIYQYTKGKSQCVLTVTTLTASKIEGTASCPVLNQQNGSGTVALQNVKFSASTK